MTFVFLKFSIYLFCTFLLFSNLHNYVYSNKFIVKIENGEIIGEETENYFAFRGIPYAIAERFAHPQRFREKWRFVRAFKEFGEVCAQYNHFSYSYQGIENCLTLNVFVPKKVAESRQKVPVIFFIHGGAFMFGGSNEYGPEIIMQNQNLILVTINYRLGILGFLSTEDEVLPGNLGLKDQVEALKWVQRNIHAFNGDSKRVTIVGLSAGGASVHLHYMSKLSDGLFNNGISHSGVAINPWVMMERGREKAHQVGDYLGCNFGNVHKSLVKCLKKAPLRKLVMTAKKFQPFLYNPFSPFGVSIEINHDNAFITEHPKNILWKGSYSKKPWIASQVLDEGLYPGSEFYNETILKMFDENWVKLAPHLLDFNGTSSDENFKEDVSNLIRNFYFKDQQISMKNYQQLIDLLSDRLFKADFYNSLSYHATQSPTYCYYFKYLIENSKSIINNSGQKLGVAHGDDVFLIFNNRKLSDYSEEEKLIGLNFVKMFERYATYGDVIFGDSKINATDVNMKCLELISASNHSMIALEKSFGNSEFFNGLNLNE